MSHWSDNYYEMGNWWLPEPEPCGFCGGTERTGHTRRCEQRAASLMAHEAEDSARAEAQEAWDGSRGSW